MEREWTMQDYIKLLRRWRVLIATCAVLGAGLAYSVSRLLPNRYTSVTTVLVEQPTVPTNFVQPVVSSDVNERLAGMKQEILSRTRLEPIIRQFNLGPEDPARATTDEVLEKLQSAIEVTPIIPLSQSGAFRMPGFSISVVWSNPHAAQDVCTAITSMFIVEEEKVREQHSEDTTAFMAQELTEAKTKLDEQDAKLADFEAHHMGSLPEQVQSNFGILNGLYGQLDAATQALTRATMDKSLTQSMLTQQIAARKASQTGKNPETYEEQLSQLQTELATLQARYTDDYPDVIKTKTQIEALKTRIAESSDAGVDLDPNKKMLGEPLQFTQLRAQIRQDDQVIADKTKQQEEIQQEIKATEARIQQSPATEQQYKQLTRDYETALQFYKDLLNKRAQSTMATDLERRQESEHFTVLDPADLPNKPSFPNRPLFALGGFGGGLGLGIGIAFLLQVRDTSFRTDRDVESALRLPVLALVPVIELLPGQNAPSMAAGLTRRANSGIRGGA